MVYVIRTACVMLILMPWFAYGLVGFAVQGGMDKKRLHYCEGGHHGNREHFINNLVKTMI